MRIISIDPGYDRVGVAIIEKNSSEKEKLIESICVTTDKKQTLSERIFFIGQNISDLITKHSPGAMALEKLYFTNNQKTAMGVSEARGVIIYEASRNGLPIFEYTPIQIKVAVTGYGKATKNNVQSMVEKLISLPEKKRLDDEVDAIAVGLTCFACERFPAND